MSKNKLATEIIKQLAQTEPAGLGFRITVPVLGYDQTFIKDKQTKLEGVEVSAPVKTSRSEALEMAADHIAAELDGGSIILSDTWAADNLKT